MTTKTPPSKPTDATTATELERKAARLALDARDLRAAAGLLGESAQVAERRYAEEVATTLSTLELDLQVAKSALDADRADNSEDLRQALDDVQEAARTWLDDLALQAGLGRMEARDRVGVVSERLEHAATEVRRSAGRLGDAIGTDLDELRHVAMDSIRDVRDVLWDAASSLRRSID